MEFGIRSDDGKVVFMSLTNKDFYDTEPYIEDVENCKEYCLRCARETAISFIGSIDGYELIEEEPITRTKEKDGKAYTITFYKPVAGYKSSDFISIRVTSKGHLMSVFTGDTNAFNDTDTTVDEAKLQRAIEEKARSIYDEAGYKIKSITIDDRLVVKSPDRKTFVYSYVSFLLSDKEGGEFNTTLGLITSIY